jgi:purine nucleoside permease
MDGADHKESTALMLAAKRGEIDTVRILLENQTPINQMATYYGWTALTYAANSGHTDVARLLLEHGADGSLKGERGKTPLVLAADRGHTAVVATLLEFGAEPDPDPDHHGWTPLRRAAQHGHIEVVRLLLSAGANPYRADYAGVTPLDIAIKNRHAEVVEIMQQVDRGNTPQVQQPARVWVFNGGGGFPSGVFTTRELAEQWIERNHLTGTLTAYPLDMGVYDWTVASGYFRPKRDDQKTPHFIARFSSAAQEHYHYENGANPGQWPEDTEG